MRLLRRARAVAIFALLGAACVCCDAAAAPRNSSSSNADRAALVDASARDAVGAVQRAGSSPADHAPTEAARNGVFNLCQSFLKADGAVSTADSAQLRAYDARPPALKMVSPPRDAGVSSAAARELLAATEDERELLSDQRPLLGCFPGLLGVISPVAPLGSSASPLDSLAGTAASALLGRGIDYHGGAVMAAQGPTPVHLIWYGDWSNGAAPAATLLPFLVEHAYTASPNFMAINELYYSGAGASRVYVNGSLALAAQLTFRDYPYGRTLSDEDVQSLVGDAMMRGLGVDASALYVVLTGADIALSSGLCSQYCGWHTTATLMNATIRFGVVGDSGRCPSSCATVTYATAPNGDVTADAMASILMHEVVEMLTDPDLDAWYDIQGLENADKCSWRYGALRTRLDGAVSNLQVGGRDFLIQQNWVPSAGGYCSMAAP